ENGSIVEGESQIPYEVIHQKSKIKKLMINPKDAKPLEDALKAIREADAIVMGPGSLYTSIIPNLLVKDIVENIKKSDAIKIYICNIMTQPGETDNFSVSDHIKVLQKYGGRNIVDYVIANRGDIPKEVKEKYLEDNSELVVLDRKEIKSLGVEAVEATLAKTEKAYVKHDTEYLSEVLVDTIMEKKLLYDRKKIIEYMYLSQRIKEKEEKSKKNNK
ncbi:MAG: gluconeogenesis factor YvcK family protein, partial [Clostridium sp.]